MPSTLQPQVKPACHNARPTEQLHHERIPALDGIRGLAILIVVWGHYFMFGLDDHSNTLLLRVTRFTQNPWVGVDLFFVLSGFLITGILLDSKGAANLLRIFYLRRAARILPPYIPLIIIAFTGAFLLGGTDAFRWVFGGLMPLSSYLSFTQNFGLGWTDTDAGHALSPTWSLAVEEQFYLIWPWVILVCKNRRQLLAICSALLLTAPLLRFIAPGQDWVFNTLFRMDCLIFGAVIAIAIRNRDLTQRLKTHSRPILLLTLTLILIGAYQCFKGTGNCLTHSIFGAATAGLVLFVLLNPASIAAKVLSIAWLRWVGKISYFLYLYHDLVRGVLFASWLKRQPHLATWEEAAVTLLSLTVALALSALSFRFYETPILAWARKSKYERVPN